MKKLSYNQICKVGHSLGIHYYGVMLPDAKKEDKKLPKQFYRNRYITTGKTGSYSELMTLVEMGYMGSETMEESENIFFYVTDQGIEEFRNQFKENIKNGKEGT